MSSNPSRPIGRAVVLGGGLGGIAAAAALRSACEEVVVVERDVLPDEPAARRGTPQADQLHNLLSRAQIELDRLLPGFSDRLRAAGCGEARVADQTHVFELGVRMPERDLGLRLMCAWRPVIEHVARTLLRFGSSVSIREQTHAVGLVLGPDGAVAGVEVLVDGRRELVEAPLVVDATGSGSQARRWVQQSGRTAPRVDEVRHDQWYVTELLERPPSRLEDSDFWLTFATPPRSRAGLLSPADRFHWHLSLSGRSDDPQPTSHDDVVAYAATLEDPAIAELVAAARPVSKPHVFRRTCAMWRRWDLVDDPIPGFLPIGDAVAALNPLFGQGTSVAAWQARELAELLNDWPGTTSTLSELTHSYLQRAASACRAAWDLGEFVGIDRGLGELVREDAAVHRTYVEMWHLLRSTDELSSTVASRFDPALSSGSA